MHKALLLLQKVPKGRVVTYGELAKAAKSSPRAIGQVMRRNAHPELYPCFKVIKSDGSVGGYAGCLSGKNAEKKIALLKKDGVKIENGKIDLKRFRYSF